MVLPVNKMKNYSLYYTVWIFHDFSVNQIFREINFGEFRSCKTPIFALLGALNVVNLVNFSLQKVQKFIKIKIGESRVSKSAIFTHFEALNIDFL